MDTVDILCTSFYNLFHLLPISPFLEGVTSLTVCKTFSILDQSGSHEPFFVLKNISRWECFEIFTPGCFKKVELQYSIQYCSHGVVSGIELKINHIGFLKIYRNWPLILILILSQFYLDNWATSDVHGYPCPNYCSIKTLFNYSVIQLQNIYYRFEQFQYVEMFLLVPYTGNRLKDYQGFKNFVTSKAHLKVKKNWEIQVSPCKLARLRQWTEKRGLEFNQQRMTPEKKEKFTSN